MIVARAFDGRSIDAGGHTIINSCRSHADRIGRGWPLSA
jgi:hypothetical protein